MFSAISSLPMPKDLRRFKVSERFSFQTSPDEPTTPRKVKRETFLSLQIMQTTLSVKIVKERSFGKFRTNVHPLWHSEEEKHDNLNDVKLTKETNFTECILFSL